MPQHLKDLKSFTMSSIKNSKNIVCSLAIYLELCNHTEQTQLHLYFPDANKSFYLTGIRQKCALPENSHLKHIFFKVRA